MQPQRSWGCIISRPGFLLRNKRSAQIKSVLSALLPIPNLSNPSPATNSYFPDTNASISSSEANGPTW
jgi:hypothetical protein